MTTATLRIVKAPQVWTCALCGKAIQPTSDCAKQAGRILCLECLMSGLPQTIRLAVEPQPPAPTPPAPEPEPPAPEPELDAPLPLDIDRLRQIYNIKAWLSPICGWEWLQYHEHPKIQYQIELFAHGVHSIITLNRPELIGEVAKTALHRARRRNYVKI